MSKQILTLISVGEKYTNLCKPHIHHFLNNDWDVIVLTDTPNEFEDCITYEYPNKIFSYFDKLLFPLRISQKEQRGVLFIDADELHKFTHLATENFRNVEDFIVFEYWLWFHNQSLYVWDTFITHFDGYFNTIKDYWNRIGYDYSNLKTIWEGLYYYPNSDKTNELLMDIESIKPIFEYMSIIGNHPYPGIGNGEGLALSYCLEKNNIKKDETKISYSYGEQNKHFISYAETLRSFSR